jgi:nucleoside-diphosphate-sugar epimerase
LFLVFLALSGAYARPQDEEDLKMSSMLYEIMTSWMKWKYEADKNLIKRDKFKWTILRPGGFSGEPSTGKVEMGRTHLTSMIPVSARKDCK